MGAYENPTIPVDTQSGQYYRELQNTIATSFAGVAKGYSDRAEETRKEYETRKKEIQANIEKAEEYGLELYSELNKSSADNKSIDWNKTYDPFIQEAVTLRSGLLNGSISDRQAALTKLSHIKSSVSNVQGSLADLASVGKNYTTAKIAGVGAANGLATNNDPNVLAALEILTNEKIPGKKELIFRDNDPTQPVWKISGKNSKGESFTQELDAGQIKNLANSTGVLQVVKDPGAEYSAVKKVTPSAFVSKQTTNSKGEIETTLTNDINPAYLGPTLERRDVAPGSETIVGGKQKQYERILYKQVNKDLMRQDGTLMAQLKAKAEANLMNPVDAFNQNNDIFAQSSDAPMLLKYPVTAEDKKQYVDNYINYFFEKQVPEIQILEKVPENVATTTYKAAEPVKVRGGGRGTGSGLSATERKDRSRIWQLNKVAVSKINKNKTGGVIVSPLNEEEGIKWDPTVTWTSKSGKATGKKGGWIPVIFSKDEAAWVEAEGPEVAIRSRSEAAKRFLQGFNPQAATIDEYFSEYSDDLPTFNQD
jgi:hypothetical protein